MAEILPEDGFAGTLIGRVNTAGRMLSWGLGWTGGAFLAGALVDWLGLFGTLVVMSMTGPIATAVAWTSPLRLSRHDAAGASIDH